MQPSQSQISTPTIYFTLKQEKTCNATYAACFPPKRITIMKSRDLTYSNKNAKKA